MECCQPTHKLPHCMPCTPRLDLNRKTGAEPMKEALHFLFAPEPSNREFPQPSPVRPRWMGAVKALVWVGLSIGAGTILAIVCS